MLPVQVWGAPFLTCTTRGCYSSLQKNTSAGHMFQALFLVREILVVVVCLFHDFDRYCWCLLFIYIYIYWHILAYPILNCYSSLSVLFFSTLFLSWIWWQTDLTGSTIPGIAPCIVPWTPMPSGIQTGHVTSLWFLGLSFNHQPL